MADIELSVRAGLCTGPGPCDPTPLGEGKNWVTERGGLPHYVRAIAHALRRERGMSEEQSITTAIAAIKSWAAGGGKVSEATRARARAAVAHWEAMKGSKGGTRSVEQDNAAYAEGLADRRANRHQQTREEFLAAHPGADADDFPLYQAGYDADRSDLDLRLEAKAGRQTAVAGTRAAEAIERLEVALGWREAATSTDRGQRDVSGVAEWANSGPPTPDASGSAALLPVGPTRKVAAQEERTIANHRFAGTDLSHCQVCGRPVSAEVHRRPKAQDAGERHAGPGHAPVATGHIKGDTHRRAVAAKAAHDRSASSLEGPLEEQLKRFFADQATSTLARLNGKRGKQMLKRAGVRAVQQPSAPPGGAGAPPPGAPPPTGTAGTLAAAGPTVLGAGITAGGLAAGSVSASTLAAALGISTTVLAQKLGYHSTPELSQALLAGLVTFEMIRMAFPKQTAAATSGPVGSVDPTAIFDQPYWNARLGDMLRPYYESAATQAAANVRSHLELPSRFDDAGSLGTARQLLEQRGNQTSPRINSDTYAGIVRALQDGVAAGEGQSGLAERVNSVFENADRVRARRIAQTEVQAALNGSANAYAQALGPDVVASKRWLAHWPPTGGEDPRTRDAHRLAAGQTVPIGSPFYVSGFPMQHPGDPAAPPELTVNCRCALMFLPPGADGGLLSFAARNIHRQQADAAGVTLSPEAASFVGS